MPFYFSMTLPGTIDTGGSAPPWKTMRHEITRVAAIVATNASNYQPKPER
jgi:hypothetical protein